MMKRQVLFIEYNSSLREEVRDFIRDHDGIVHFADTTRGSIRILEDFPIDLVILNMHQILDAGILRYINLNYPGIKVYVYGKKEFDEIIKIFNKGHFSLLQQPLSLADLNKII
jgi:DNA-binding NtrC family response regulator